jgi:DNA-binding NtrC family response regulator
MESNRILVIDDESIICEGCRRVLSDQGYVVDTCLNGRGGLDRLLSEAYDLILLDIRLRDMDGMEILRQVRKHQPGLYVVVITGYASVENAVAAIKQGAFDYLSKPFTDDELLIAVQKAMENKRLKKENLALRRQLSERYDFEHIIGESPGITKVFEDIRKVAPTDSTVLLYGESGTGKEVFARAIHAQSKRAAQQFIIVDCGTFSSTLLESELFGHIKGAFTGAINDRAGIFEVADHGTLFLDEVSNLDAEFQAKLLRTMDTHEFKPVGASRLKKADVRIIAATNRDLKKRVDEGTFREDLYYRFNVFPIFIPPLRERRDDIPRLLYHFLEVYRRQIRKHIDGFSDEAIETLVNYDWPGNVRQLKNVVERLVIVADEGILDHQNLFDHCAISRNQPMPTVPETLAELKSIKRQLLIDQFGLIEKAFLLKALSATGGNIAQAAKRVGMQRSNFSALMKKHGVSSDSKGSP